MSNTTTKIIVGISLVAVVALCLHLLRPSKPKESTPAKVATAGEGPSSLQLPATAVTSDTPQDDARILNLEQRVMQESRARETAEADAAALREKIAPLEGNIVVSLGKIDDIGKRAGSILPALREMRALASRDRGTLSGDEKRRLLDLQRQHADVLGMLPEIAGFQDHPGEYGQFFRSMVQQAAELSDSQASQVEGYMAQRAMIMNQLQLNASNEPTDPALEEPWEERRDEFNVQTAAGLRALLPPGAADKAGISPELMELLEMDFDKAENAALAK